MSAPSRSWARLSLLAIVVGALLVAACGDDDIPVDAGFDAGSRVDAGHRDAGPACDLMCPAGERCCFGESGPACIRTVDDVDHCGGCGRTCREGKGISCSRSACVCGIVEGGCAGTRDSTCCPPRVGGTMPYCADFDSDPLDCGGCGLECAEAASDRCLGGVCVCGVRTTGCEGTPESMCCRMPIDEETACVDTTTDRQNCGACGWFCEAGERCEGGICTRGDEVCESCGATEICCGGGCCSRSRCISGACM